MCIRDSTEKDYEKVGQKMQEAYEALPKAFMGYPARNTSKRGGGRVGEMCIRDSQNIVPLCIRRQSAFPLVESRKSVGKEQRITCKN